LAFVLWLLAGQVLSLRGAVIFSIAVFALVVAAPLLHHGEVAYASVLGPLVGGLFALGISRGYLALLEDARRREQLVRSLEQAQEDMAALHDELALPQRHAGRLAERARLARDLHDTVAQGLSSISLLASASAASAGDGDRGLRQIESLARENLEDLRRIIAALTPAELADQALPAALARVVDRFRAETGIEARLEVDESLPMLEPRAEVAL